MHPGYVPDKVISDAELVVLARAGEAGAFGMLVERHRAALYAAALAVLGDRDAAMDAVQEAFMVSLTRLNSIRDPAAVGRWLRMVVRNCALMQIRRVRHEVVGGDLEAWASTPGQSRSLTNTRFATGSGRRSRPSPKRSASRSCCATSPDAGPTRRSPR
jgi:DNA-directed RNA polymerase specialized sigma24 family protein